MQTKTRQMQHNLIKIKWVKGPGKGEAPHERKLTVSRAERIP
jgi:hypothetical protein